MAKPRVSVIIPAYQCSRVIGFAIDSLLKQTRLPDEIIVVDDGSSDDIVAALRHYGSSVRLVRKENGGASSARNAGIDIATGDMIAFLDSDDFWHPTKLQEQLRIFEEHPEVGLISSRYLVKKRTGTTEEYPLLSSAPWDRVLRPEGGAAFKLAMDVWTSVVIFRREVLGDARFDLNLKTAEDRDLWATLVSRTAIYLQSEMTATLVEMEGSLSRTDLDGDCRSMLRVIDKHKSLLGRWGVRKWEASVYRRWAGTYLGHGEGDRALKPAVRRLWYQPLSPEGWWVLAKSSFVTLGGAPAPMARTVKAAD